MKFGDLVIHNFMSFRHAEVNLGMSGLVLVDGQVENTPGFSSNGAGKSAIFEALTWCLFGKTIRGIDANGVVNNKAKRNCQVSVDIDSGDGKFTIIRTRKHSQYGNSLRVISDDEDIAILNDVAANQLKVNSILGLDFQSFSNSLIFGQGNIQRFSMATDATRKEIMETLLNLSYLPKAQDIVKAKIGKLDTIRQVAEHQVGLLDVHLGKLNSDLISHRQAVKEFKLRKIISIMNYISAVELDEDAVKHLEDRILPFDNSGLREASSKHTVAEAKLRTAIFRMQKSTEHVRPDIISIQITALNQRIADIMERSISISEGGNCDKCGQPILKATIDRQLKELAKYEVEKRNELAGVEIQFKKAEKAEKDALHNVEEVGRCERVVMEARRVLDVERENKRQRDLAKEQLIAAYNRLRTSENTVLIECRTESYQEHMVTQTNNEIELARLEKVGLLEKLTDIQDEIEHLQFWVEAFSNRGIKSMIIDSVIPYLNERAAIYSGILTGNTVQVEFANETKLKSGDTRDKLTILAKRTTGGNVYDELSGGEKKRADFIISAAIRDLVGSVGGDKVDFLFLDECFESLDNAGTERAIELLDELNTRYGTIFVATHIEEVKELFSQRIVVNNSKGVSTIGQ
jgi:DNA repair exonuclease SbcCD ATPase subunit